MDKSRDVRRGASRFSRQIKQSGQKLLAGLDGVAEDFVSLEKPKKERLIKKLSVVNKASSSYGDCEMRCNTNLSDRENEFPSQSQFSMSNATTKTFKLPKKFFDNRNCVDHSSVPRKLRSAMKKRNLDSISPPLPDSRELNHTIGGVESLKKDGLKKSKLNMKKGSLDWSHKQTVGSITKDEEEVVETLYALARMFPDNDTADKTKLDIAPSEANPPALLEHRESPTPAIKDSAVTKEDLSSTCPLRNSEVAPLSNIESMQKEPAEVNSLKEASAEEKPDLLDSKNFHTKTDSCVPPVNVHSIMPSLSKREHNNDEQSCNPVNLHVLPELSLDSGLEQSTHKESSLQQRKPEVASGAATFRSQLLQQDMVMESRKNGLALWPGLSPMVLHGVGSSGPSSQSPAAKIPAWLDGATRSCSLENGPLTGKVYEGATDRASMKRCAAHVYISHLIRDLQMPENKEKLPLHCNQLKPRLEGQRQGIPMAINDFDRVKKGLNGVISSNNIGSTTAERNSSEARSCILQHKRLHQDQQQTATASGLHNLQKQSFDFLSLSAGGGGPEATNCFHRNRNNALEQSSPFQVSYLQSLPQHQKFMPLAMSQSYHSSSSYPDKSSTSATAPTQQVPLQLLPYLTSPFLGPAHTSSTILTKQHHHQQQQQQLWAAQLAAHCRPAGNSTAMSQFPHCPNGTQDSTLIPCPQSIISPSLPALEILGPKYTQISQQQQQQQQRQHQLVAITSSLPSAARVKRQDHHLPVVYEEIDGGFRTGGSLPLQLLCNERH
ncbi:Restriction of telomere capping protein [Melia azedarach]|uniref:Restriction of telomere capping protein n=2 Tax=Melia azedarach TaxID=155640 RepID=A0ACC1WUZ1_MELAZ|nr:Restriction of telomere capping protein [Melia azedarach]KAJ4702114.1 Restriction of telomere capping protein [Melia azedarach]